MSDTTTPAAPSFPVTLTQLATANSTAATQAILFSPTPDLGVPPTVANTGTAGVANAAFSADVSGAYTLTVSGTPNVGGMTNFEVSSSGVVIAEVPVTVNLQGEVWGITLGAATPSTLIPPAA